MNMIIWAVMISNNDQEATTVAMVRGVFKEGALCHDPPFDLTFQ